MEFEHYWLVPEWLMGGPWPWISSSDWLEWSGVSVIVNLTEDPYDDPRFEVHHIPIPDMMPPDITQIKTFCDIAIEARKQSKVVYVHCLAGRGRTGTMMACLLVYHENMPASEAIERVRELMPGSIESDAQAETVFEWEEYLQEIGFEG